MNSPKHAACFSSAITHAAFAYDELYTGLFYEIVLELLHPHGCGRPYGDYFKTAFFRTLNYRTCMHECHSAYVNRKVHSFFDDPNMDIITPDALEAWIKAEYLSVSGKPMTDKYGDFARIEQFAHGGMSSGGVDNLWWMDEGIPLLKSRLAAL